MKLRTLQRLSLIGFILWGCGSSLTGCEQAPSHKKPQDIQTPQPISSPASAEISQPPRYQLDLSQASPAASETRQPGTIDLFFCLDVSGSMGERMGAQRKIDISKAALGQVFTQIASYVRSHPEKRAKVGLCAFADRAVLLQPMDVFDPNKAEQVVQSLQPSGNTAIGEALILGVKEILKSGAETRAILVMTDGENNRGVPPEQVVEAIKQDSNNQQVPTADIDVFLVAFDVNAGVFNGVKKAGAFVVESRDQKSLEGILSTLVEQVLLEAN